MLGLTQSRLLAIRGRFIKLGLVVMLCWLALPLIVGAVPPLPCVFYGSVSVNGSDVPDGTIISAWIGGVRYDQYASLTYLGASSYVLTIPGDDPDTAGIKEGGASGETIQFKIGNLVADQTAAWQESGGGTLNLTATGASPAAVYLPLLIKNRPLPPTATPTPSPTRTSTRPAGATSTSTATRTRTPTSTWPTWTPAPTTVVLTQAQDTYIHVFEDVPKGSEGELHVKTGQQSKRPLIRFDLSGIPTNAVVDSARMTLQTNWYAPTDWPMEVRCYLLKRGWVESEATWQYAVEDQPWGLPGADSVTSDRDSVHVASFVVDAENKAYTFDVTDAARQWVANPGGNHGLILIGDGNISEYRFYSAQCIIDIALRPRLEMRVRIP